MNEKNLADQIRELLESKFPPQMQTQEALALKFITDYMADDVKYHTDDSLLDAFLKENEATERDLLLGLSAVAAVGIGYSAELASVSVEQIIGMINLTNQLM